MRTASTDSLEASGNTKLQVMPLIHYIVRARVILLHTSSLCLDSEHPYMCVCVCVHVHVYVCAYVCVHMCVCMHVHMAYACACVWRGHSNTIELCKGQSSPVRLLDIISTMDRPDMIAELEVVLLLPRSEGTFFKIILKGIPYKFALHTYVPSIFRELHCMSDSALVVSCEMWSVVCRCLQ